jgi:signal transduction histidine kinase
MQLEKTNSELTSWIPHLLKKLAQSGAATLERLLEISLLWKNVPHFAFLVSIGGMALVGALDWSAGKEISLSILYLVPLSFGVWHAGFKPGLILAVTGAGVWFCTERAAGITYADAWIPFWNTLVRVGVFSLIAWLLNGVRLLKENLEIAVGKLNIELERETADRKALECGITELRRKDQERLAHDLHDRLGGYLSGVVFRAKLLGEQLERRNAPEAAEASRLVLMINAGIEKVGGIARVLIPIEHGNADLEGALSRFCAEVQKFYGVACSLEAGPVMPELSSDQTEQLCRVAQEAVRNAIRHARASKIKIGLQHEERSLSLSIENEGAPWEPAATCRSGGLGLRIMRHRSDRIGAALSINRGKRGGTCVVCKMPITRTTPALEWQLQDCASP